MGSYRDYTFVFVICTVVARRYDHHDEIFKHNKMVLPGHGSLEDPFVHLCMYRINGSNILRRHRLGSSSKDRTIFCTSRMVFDQKDYKSLCLDHRPTDKIFDLRTRKIDSTFVPNTQSIQKSQIRREICQDCTDNCKIVTDCVHISHFEKSWKSTQQISHSKRTRQI